MHHYHKNDHNFQLVDDNNNEIMWSGPVVAIMFDKSSGILYKHGDPELVLAEFNMVTQTLSLASHADLAENLVVVRSDAWDIAILNKCLDITGWVGLMARRYGLMINPPLCVILDELADNARKRHGGERPKQQEQHQPFAHDVIQFRNGSIG